MTQLCKTDTRQKNLKYNYNAYTDDEIRDILGPKKRIISAITNKLTFKIDKKEGETDDKN